MEGEEALAGWVGGWVGGWVSTLRGEVGHHHVLQHGLDVQGGWVGGLMPI